MSLFSAYKTQSRKQINDFKNRIIIIIGCFNLHVFSGTVKNKNSIALIGFLQKVKMMSFNSFTDI